MNNSEEQLTNYNSSQKIIAIAASAGGLKAISEVVSQLPSDFPASILVVQHLDPKYRSLMADILSRRTPLTVKEAMQGEKISPSTIYIAPPNYHLLIEPDGTIALTQTKLVHFVRPSADLLFESVAGSYEDNAIAVVLTGTGTDGEMGVKAIKKMGGTIIAQNQETSEFFGMPGTAVKTGVVDLLLPLSEIAPTLVKLVTEKDG